MKSSLPFQHRIIQTPALNVVLYQPEIPANTGNIARLCGAARIRLHLIHPLGFRVDDKHLKRAGLDYWYEVDVRHHDNMASFQQARIKMDRNTNVHAFSRHAHEVYTSAPVSFGDYLLFGKETQGLPEPIHSTIPSYRIPIWGNVRSLNLSTSVGIVVYEYLRQLRLF